MIVASDGLFRHLARERILAIVRAEKLGRVGDALIEAARLPSGDLADDIAILVAEP